MGGQAAVAGVLHCAICCYLCCLEISPQRVEAILRAGLVLV